MNANKPYEFHMSDLFTLQHTDRLDGGGTFESLLYTMAEEMGFVTRFRGDFALDVARLQEEGSKAAFTGSWIWITRRNELLCESEHRARPQRPSCVCLWVDEENPAKLRYHLPRTGQHGEFLTDDFLTNKIKIN